MFPLMFDDFDEADSVMAISACYCVMASCNCSTTLPDWSSSLGIALTQVQY